MRRDTSGVEITGFRESFFKWTIEVAREIDEWSQRRPRTDFFEIFYRIVWRQEIVPPLQYGHGDVFSE